MKPWQVVFLVVIAIGVFAVLGVGGYLAYNAINSEPTVAPIEVTSAVEPTAPPDEPPPAERPCAQLGQMCGGIMGIQCCGKLVCLYDGKPNAQYPDQSGVCAAEAPKPDEPTVEPPAPCRVQIPDVIGMGIKDAEATARGLNLLLITSKPVCADGKPYGVVLSQSPAAGTAAACGDAITIILSSGQDCSPKPCQVTVSNWIGKDRTVAEKQARDLGLNPSSKPRCSRDNVVGSVEIQSLAAGTTVVCGTQIVFTYADANICPPCTSKVPDVLRKPVSEAVKLVQQANLTPTVVEQCGRWYAPDDTVHTISPFAGTTVLCGSEVRLNYCPKSAGATVVDVTGKTIEDAEAALKSAGFIAVLRAEECGTQPADGIVHKMSPAPGTFQLKGKEILLYFCPRCEFSCPVGEGAEVYIPGDEVKDMGFFYRVCVDRGYKDGLDLKECHDFILQHSCMRNFGEAYPGMQMCLPKPKPCMTRWPMVMGMQIADAEKVVRDANLVPVRKPLCGRPEDNGKVHQQSLVDPYSGSIADPIPCGLKIALYYTDISLCQPVKVRIPNVMGMQFAAAEKALKDAGLMPVVHAQCGGGDLPNDLVHTCAPAVGQELDPGTQVEIYYCPKDITTFGAYEEFEHGWIFWRQDTGDIYVLEEGHLWRVFKNTWQDADGEFPCGVPHGIERSCPPMPKRGIGKVWCQLGPEALPSIGWATTCEQGYNMAIKIVGDQTRITDPSGRVFVLRSDGVWWTGF